MARVGGIIQFQIDGRQYDAKGSFETNLGRPMLEAVVGSDGVHGFKETPQVPFINGAVTLKGSVDRDTILGVRNATITVSKANGKIFTLRGGYFAGEGTDSTDEGEMQVRFEGSGAEEV